MSETTPMHADYRRGNYVRQNNGGPMTPRQRRRWKRKLNAHLRRQGSPVARSAGWLA